MTTRSFVLRSLAVAVSLALLAWLFADARWHGVALRLTALDPSALAAVALLFAVSYGLRAARVHGEFRDEIAVPGDRRGYLRILRLTLVHNALVNVLPFRSGEAAFPVLLGRWFGIPTGRAVVSLLWLRAQDATVMAALAAASWPGLATGWRVAIGGAALGLALAVPRWARGRLGRPVATEAGTKRWRSLLERATRRSTSGWLWTVGNWTVKLAAEAWLLRLALGDGAAPSGALVTTVAGAVGAEGAAILPIQGVAGFGTFEAGAAALLRAHGVALQAGLEAALVLHVVVLGLALVAGAMAAACLPGARRSV